MTRSALDSIALCGTLMLGLIGPLPMEPASAQESVAVDLELVLAADGSGSIDATEMALQREGYASAITSPEILDAIAQGFDGRIAVTYVEGES